MKKNFVTFLSLVVLGVVPAIVSTACLSVQRSNAADGKANRQSALADDDGREGRLPGNEDGRAEAGRAEHRQLRRNSRSGAARAKARRLRAQPITTTQFPQPPGMGESWDPDLVRQAAGVEGYEARFITQTPKYDRQMLMLWGPQADLARDPRWGRSEEVYGEDPFFNGTMVTAFVKGLQGDDPKYWQAAALLKHFLANSNENLRTKSNSDFDQRLFWEYYSVPFRMGFVDGGAKAVMASYNAWNGTPMAINPILKSIVEDQWGVDVMSSDGGAVRLLVTDHKCFPTQKRRSSRASRRASISSSNVRRRNQSRVERWLDHREGDR